METKRTSFRRLIVPLLFGLVSAGLALTIWLSFGGVTPLAARGYRVSLTLPDASDLYVGSDVAVSGVKVGEVHTIERRGTVAQVVLALDASFAPLRTEAHVIKRTKSLLGEGYIEIAPGPTTALPIPEGGHLPASGVRAAQSLNDVLQTFSPPTRRNVSRLFKGMSTAFANRGPAFSGSLAGAADTTSSFSSVFDTLEGQQSDLAALFARSADVLTAVGSRQAVLQTAVRSGNDVLDVTARGQRDLEVTIRGLPSFLRSLRNASSAVSAASGDLRAAVSSLRPVAPDLKPALASIERAAPDVRGTFRELPPVLAAGERGLPAVSAIASSAGASLKTVYPVSREVVPTLQLLAELRGTISSFFANIGSFFNGRILPGNTVQTGVGAVPSVWNETLAGWKKRLPSHRPNPYPKPGAAQEIGKGGLLSYDCRHLNNTLFLETTGGTGAPPCRLQGPWTFQGKTRYYPALSLSPP